MAGKLCRFSSSEHNGIQANYYVFQAVTRFFGALRNVFHYWRFSVGDGEVYTCLSGFDSNVPADFDRRVYSQKAEELIMSFG